MVKILTKCKIEKSCLLLNVIFLFLSLCIVNSSIADEKESEDFPWEIFYPAFIKKSIDKDKDGFTKEQGDCNDTDSSINPNATEICGDGIDQDCDGRDLPCEVILDVPFEPNHGGTCVASSFTMALRYLEPTVTFDDVYNIFGLPPFDNNEYENFNNWIKNNFDLEMKHYSHCTIDDIILCINEGYPAVVHQQDSLSLAEGHMRVVIGYNLDRQEFIIHDPSNRGKNYRESFSVFEKLWKLITNLESVPPNQIFLLESLGQNSPLD